MTDLGTHEGHRNTRYFLGHQILRHSGRGCRWFTIDEGQQRFDSSQAAVQFIRSLEPIQLAA